MDYQTLKIKYQPAVKRIQLYRPEAQNTINSQLTEDLLSALQATEQEESIKIIVLEGLPDVFCTGMDFQEVAENQTDDPKESSENYYNICRYMTENSKVVISLVRGKVQAGGVGFVAASDLVIADETATFVLSELLFGLLPACVLPFLIRRVGFHKAYRLALTTQEISYAEAHQWGLVDEYSPDAEKNVRQYFRRLKYLPTEGIQRLKQYTQKLWIMDDETKDLAVNTISGLVSDRQIQETIRRYVQEGVFPWQT